MQTDISLTHIPPQAIEIEESILASCLLGDAYEAVELLKPDDFYKTAHQKIFSSRKIRIVHLFRISLINFYV